MANTITKRETRCERDASGDEIITTITTNITRISTMQSLDEIEAQYSEACNRHTAISEEIASFNDRLAKLVKDEHASAVRIDELASKRARILRALDQEYQAKKQAIIANLAAQSVDNNRHMYEYMVADHIIYVFANGQDAGYVQAKMLCMQYDISEGDALLDSELQYTQRAITRLNMKKTDAMRCAIAGCNIDEMGADKIIEAISTKYPNGCVMRRVACNKYGGYRYHIL
jgi:hypothetical protein